jgi:hypothetical protein
MCLAASILDEVNVAGGAVGANMAVAEKVFFRFTKNNQINNLQNKKFFFER